jgi:hypothetical protein
VLRLRVSIETRIGPIETLPTSEPPMLAVIVGLSCASGESYETADRGT